MSSVLARNGRFSPKIVSLRYSEVDLVVFPSTRDVAAMAPALTIGFVGLHNCPRPPQPVGVQGSHGRSPRGRERPARACRLPMSTAKDSARVLAARLTRYSWTLDLIRKKTTHDTRFRACRLMEATALESSGRRHPGVDGTAVLALRTAYRLPPSRSGGHRGGWHRADGFVLPSCSLATDAGDGPDRLIVKPACTTDPGKSRGRPAGLPLRNDVLPRGRQLGSRSTSPGATSPR